MVGELKDRALSSISDGSILVNSDFMPPIGTDIILVQLLLWFSRIYNTKYSTEVIEMP